MNIQIKEIRENNHPQKENLKQTRITINMEAALS